MTNQAAQTMPELPPSFARVHNDGYWTLRVRDTAEFIVHDSRQTPAQEVYSSGQMRDMYQQGYAAALSQTAGVPSWIVNDLGELGVMVNGVAYFLYKGNNIVYEDAKHDDGSPMLYRMVGKREFGEVCHPRHWEKSGWAAAHRYTQELIYTPGLSFGKPEDGDWRPLPAQGAARAASGAHPDALPDGTLSKSTAKRVEALAASGGEDTNPAPGHDVDEYLSDYVRIAHLIGSIFFYGNFKAETFNERELESLLRKVGRFYESEEQVISGEPAVERPLHFATENLIRRFSDALREKLSAAEKKYGYSDGWASPDWMDECRKHLMQHIAKGDPRDVAAYCAFLWHHGESTTPQPPSAASVSERARAIEILAGVCLVPPSSIAENTDSDVSVELALRAIEQALTQQRGECEEVDSDAWADALELPEGYTVEEFLPGGWHYAWTRADGERMVSGTTWNHPALAAIAAWQYAPATTPQPSADAVREYVTELRAQADQKMGVAGACAHDGDRARYKSAAQLLRRVADELESLLSAASGEGVGGG